MAEKTIKQDIRSFAQDLHLMNTIYEQYATSVNLPYTSLQILNLLTEIKDCTQKTICESTFLPKQTVNTIIMSFYKKGLIKLIEKPEDRRAKLIVLTEAGEAFVNQIIPKIRKAEYEAMKTLTDEERKSFLKGMHLYCAMFEKIMKGEEEDD